MIITETVYNAVKEWIITILGDIDVVPLLPSDSISHNRYVSLYLKEIIKSQSTGSRPVKHLIQLTLSYMITVKSDNIHDANNCIASLAVSAMTKENMELDLKGVSPSEWVAMGITSCPVLLINLPLNCEIEPESGKIVEKPIIIKSYFK